MDTKFLSTFKAARRVATPLIAVRTPDPAATIDAIVSTSNGSPMISWDIIRGLRGVSKNDATVSALANILGERDPSFFANPAEALTAIVGLPAKAIVFMLNAHRFLSNEAVAQAVWNLRDIFKGNGSTLVMLCPSITLPAELSQDVLVLDEPLPTTDELRTIITDTLKQAKLDAPEPTIVKAIDATCGLAAFPAEQATAMSCSKEGLDTNALWERKRQQIEQTPGLSVWRGGQTFDSIGGNDNAKKFFRQVLAGEQPPRAIVFIDEIEKAMSGSAGDTSGVSQEMLGTLLTYMQDKGATGVIAVGPPGAGKSEIAKAAGNTGNIPTIAFDLSGMKGSLVGESGANLRNALKVVEAVSQGRTLFIATCNSIGSLPPELRRRFSFGTFFFDLPDAEERAAIWSIYLDKFGIKKQEKPDDAGWTGAEIKMCCDLAYRLKTTLKDAAAFIVPVSRSAADQIEKLRTQANGRFISASKPGVYRYDKTAPAASTGRAIAQE
jgi:hypothetical protein